MSGVLVTGSRGLVGTAICAQLEQEGAPFTPLDRGACDLTNAEAVHDVLTRVQPSAVIHTAAMTAVDACETERTMAWATNVEATAHLARACERVGARLIHVSTDYVFDGRTGGYNEDSPLSPLGVYAQTKAAAELAVRTLCTRFVIARTAVPFGPYPVPRKDFVRWLRDELVARRPVRIVTDQISSPTYTPDLARMLISLCEATAVGVAHTCGATSLSRYDFACLVCRELGLDETLIQPIVTADLQQRAPRPRDASLASTRDWGFARRDLGEALRSFARDGHR